VARIEGVRPRRRPIYARTRRRRQWEDRFRRLGRFALTAGGIVLVLVVVVGILSVLIALVD
jgi:hypothetical protein